MDTFRDAYVVSCGKFGVKPRDKVLEAVAAAKIDGKSALASVELLGNSKELFTNRVTDADMEALVDALLSTGTPVEGLYLFFNHITDAGATALSRLFHDSGAYTCKLQRLDLRGNGLTSVGCKALTEALISSRNSTLLMLNLNGNPIGDAGGLAVAEWLQNGTPVEILDLGNTELETDAVIALASVLQSNTTLQHLSLENPRLFSRMEDTMYHIARMLRANTGLLSINLSKNRIADFGARLLSEYLGSNVTLRSLILRCNNIASVGGEALASLFLRGSPIEELDLDSNRIGDDGGVAFAIALRRCPTVLSLNLKNNSIGNKGLTALAHAFNDNSTLQTLFLWGNHFEQEATNAFASQYFSAFQSMGISVDFRPYDGGGVTMLAEAAVS